MARHPSSEGLPATGDSGGGGGCQGRPPTLHRRRLRPTLLVRAPRTARDRGLPLHLQGAPVRQAIPAAHRLPMQRRGLRSSARRNGASTLLTRSGRSLVDGGCSRFCSSAPPPLKVEFRYLRDVARQPVEAPRIRDSCSVTRRSRGMARTSRWAYFDDRQNHLRIVAGKTVRACSTVARTTVETWSALAGSTKSVPLRS